MAIHVGILKRPLLGLILSGRKTVESRLTKTPRPPYGRITAGERIYLKASGGPFMALARASNVESHEHLTPRRLTELEARYNQRVCGDQQYWQTRRGSRFAVFIELGEVEPIDVGPSYPRLNMVAWHVVDGAYDPIRDVTITGANLRNNYVRLEGVSDQLRRSRLTLWLPDGQTVETSFAQGSMLRWRGWGRYFRHYGLSAGDRVRFLSLGDQRYRVSFRARG